MQVSSDVSVRRLVAIGIAVGVLFGSAVVPATDVYRCDDGAGGQVFSDRPCGERPERVRLRDSNVIKAPPVEGIRLQLLHAGRPIKSWTAATPTFTVWDEKRNTPKYTVRYHPGEDSYSFAGLVEGHYSINISIDANRENPANYPGDYRGSVRYPNIKGRDSIIPVNMEKLIRLVKPQDNRLPLVPWSTCDQVIALAPGTDLEWETLGPDVSYTFDIRRTECQPFKWKESVLNQRTTASRINLDLPVNAPGQIYTLTLKAHAAGGLPVGTLMTHGLGGYGWDYRFRIVGPPATPDRTMSK